jgi:3-oxoacyl-[acyl-carrier protein] reductase
MGKLDEKVAVITGAAMGIGKQIALKFAREGADIVIGDITDMESSAKEITDLGRNVLTVNCNTTKKPEVENLIKETVTRFGKVDIMVNNAGIRRHASLLDMTEEEWDAVLEVNLKGVFFCMQAVAKQMMKQKYGKIVSLSSVAAIPSGRTTAGVNYQCSKSGVIMLTRAAAGELGPYGINVNAMAPALTPTEGAFSVQKTPELKQQLIDSLVKTTPLGKICTTADIANLALFLASDDSSFITGQVIILDGGRV